MKLTVVIPARNEETNVEKMVSLLFKNFDKRILEVIVVDDCSKDKTPKILENLRRKFKKLKVIHRQKNPGVGNAIRGGLAKVSGQATHVLLLDCDFIENIKDIDRLIKSIGDADGVLGSRYMKGGVLINYPVVKKVANRLFHSLVRLLLGISHRDLTNNFKFYKREVIESIRPILKSSGFSINAETGLYPVLLGYYLKESPVSWIGRTPEMGSSNFKVIKAGPGYGAVFLQSMKYKYFGFPKNKIHLDVSERIHFDKLVRETGETYYGNLRPVAKLRFKRKSMDILRLLKEKQNPKVLEVGCGTGLLSKDILAARKSIQIEGIDLSPEAIKVAKRALQKYKNASFKVGNALKLPFTSGSFDAVVGNSILHHLPLRQTLREVKRVLKPNGVIWFCEPNLLNPQIFLEKNVPFLKSFFQDSKDERAFLSIYLKDEFKKLGFKNVAVRPYEFLHPMIPGFLIGWAIALEKVPVLREFAGTLAITASKEEVSR